MEKQQLKKIFEAALLAAGNTLTVDKLAQLFPEDGRPENKDIKDILEEMQGDYEDRSFTLKQIASGYCFQVKQEYSEWMQKLWEEKPSRYSRAYLETISIIAYRQPATRGEIEEIRGVAVSSNIIKSMLDREWVKVLGHKDVPGRPALYGTTKQFLDYFNLKTLDELPTLEEIKDLADAESKLDQQMELAMTEAGAAIGDEGIEDGEAANVVQLFPESAEQQTDESVEAAHELISESESVYDAESEGEEVDEYIEQEDALETKDESETAIGILAEATDGEVSESGEDKLETVTTIVSEEKEVALEEQAEENIEVDIELVAGDADEEEVDEFISIDEGTEIKTESEHEEAVAEENVNEREEEAELI